MTASLATQRWADAADLPLKLIGNVPDRLCDVADFVRFHFDAVCKPWRDTAVAATPATRPASLPTRLYNGVILQYPYVNLIRVSPEPQSRIDVLPGPLGASYEYKIRSGDRNWVANEDGTAVRHFAMGAHPRLRDLTTGAVTLLPPFPDDDDDDDEIKRRMERPRGIVYRDGTILLYSLSPGFHNGHHLFTVTAAILHLGDAKWTVVEKRLLGAGSYCFGATYHAGRLLLWNGESCHVLTLNPEANNNDGNSVVGEDMPLKVAQDDTIETEGREYICDHSYCLVSHGELLWVSVMVEHGWYHGYNHEDPPPGAVSLTVYVLERAAGGSNRMQWVKKDGSSLGDRVMFLGSPASFTVDVAELGLSGGYAYFVFKRGVYSYNLVDGKAKLVNQQERLNLHSGADKIFMWQRKDRGFK